RHRQPDGHELQKWRSRRAGDSKPEPRVGGEREREHREAEETPFLADAAADEIVVPEGHEPELLAAFANPAAEETTRPYGDERLPKLILGLRHRAARIEERDHAQQDVLQALHLVPEHGNADHAEHDEVPNADATGEQHD